MLGRLLKAYSINNKALFLIFLGSFTWSLTMVKSGLVFPYGMGFWGPNGHDGVWHIALTQGLAKGSWQMPVFTGESIKNYHIGFDLILASFNKLTFIPIHNLYFQILPPIFAFLVGYFAYKFVFEWRKSASQAFWATFFVYFGGSWGWIVTLLRGEGLGGESIFWSQQSISTLINPPFALSLILIFSGLWILIKGLKTKDRKLLAISTFLFGALIQVKVYAGILISAGLFVAGFWEMLKGKGISLIKVFTGSLILSILLFSPVSRGIEQNLILKPFWFLETMMSFPDRVGWQKFGQAMVDYKLSGNWLKAIFAYLLAFVIFWFGNLGTRIIKEPQYFRHLRNFKALTYLEVFMYAIVGLGLLITTFFIQSGTPWNTIQFMYYSLVFSGILAGIYLGGYFDNLEKTRGRTMIYHSRKMATAFFILILTLPTTIGTLKHYLPSRPPAKISKEELEALEFLSKQPDGVVLTQPFNKEAALAAVSSPPRPLYLYESTAYVSAFSGKPVYLEDEVNLEITGYDWRQRKKAVEEFYKNPDQNFSRTFLRENNIQYIYWIRSQGNILSEQGLGVYKVFENGEVDIYKVI